MLSWHISSSHIVTMQTQIYRWIIIEAVQITKVLITKHITKMKAFNTQKYLLQINLITLASHVKRDSNSTILEFKEVEDNNLLRLQATINDKFLPPFLQTQPLVNAYTVLGWFKVSITKNNLKNSFLLEPDIPNSSLRNFLQKIIKLFESDTSSTILILCTKR